MDFFDFKKSVSRRKKGAVAGAGPEPAEAGGSAPLTVTQLTAQVDRAIRTAFPEVVRVRGEASNLTLHRASGHLYFTLKDATACLDCVMYKSRAELLRFAPEEGMELVLTGRMMVYGPRGRYQLNVSSIEPVGRGALELALRQLQAKLAAEGLFDPARKRPIPPYPQRIAIVTSTQTAALADMLKVLGRFQFLKLMVYPVPVQGEGAGRKIAAALRDLSERARDVGGADVVLLGRGGGSLEDLWEFNSEEVARAVAASRIPVVTGIGHEVDVSTADLAADHHAHTPTEAAQVVTQHWRAAPDRLDQASVRLRREVRRLLGEARQRLVAVERHELFRRPLERINLARQLLDDRQRALALAMAGRIRRLAGQVQAVTARLEQYRPASILLRLRGRLSAMTARLMARHPRNAIALARQRLDLLGGQLARSVRQQRERRRQRLEALAAHLNAIGPEQVLRRGYSITTLKRGGAVVRSAAQVRPGDKLVTRLADGTIESTAEDRRQMSLFE